MKSSPPVSVKFTKAPHCFDIQYFGPNVHSVNVQRSTFLEGPESMYDQPDLGVEIDCGQIEVDIAPAG